MNHSRHYTTARLGRWLPAEPKHLYDWLTKSIEAAEQKKAPFHPVVEEFRAMIENDPEMYMYFTQMFEQQAPFAPPIGSGDVDGNDNIWVANFSSESAGIVELCGFRTENCRQV